MKIGFIGLGLMGLPIATNLLRAGHTLKVYNRTAARAQTLKEQGAVVAATPAQAASDAECVITMLADDTAVESVIFDKQNGVLQSLRGNAVHIGMSTISVALSKRLTAAHTATGQTYIATPVFGRPEAAAAAKLWVVTAGESDVIERHKPLFDAIGQGMFHVGLEPYKANVVKLAGNFTIMSMLETLGESFAFARKNGVEAKTFLDVLTGTLFNVPVYKNYGKIIAEEQFEPAGFKAYLGLKDIRLVLEGADAAGVPMPVGNVVHDHFLSIVAKGKGEIDWASLASVSAENAGLNKDK